MKWDKGYSSAVRAFQVDPKTWTDIGEYNIVDGSISRNTDSLQESADITMTKMPEDGEIWIRIYLYTTQNGATERVALFTGLTSTPQRDMDGGRNSYTLQCYSVLKPYSNILLDLGYYVPKGANGAETAGRLLTGYAPVAYDDSTSPSLSGYIIAEDGETRLSMALKVLEAINWRARLSGDGKIHIEPRSNDEKITFDAVRHDVIEPKVTDKKDWFDAPNVFRAISGETVCTVRDETESNPLSVEGRGREIWEEERDVTLNDGETLRAYAYRRLREAQSCARTISYSRRFHPEIRCGDIVRLNYTDNDLSGRFRVLSQKITLGKSCRTEEEAVEIG